MTEEEQEAVLKSQCGQDLPRCTLGGRDGVCAALAGFCSEEIGQAVAFNQEAQAPKGEAACRG